MKIKSDIRALLDDQSGIAAIEFALTCFIFFMTIFFIYMIYYETVQYIELRLAATLVTRDTKTLAISHPGQILTDQDYIQQAQDRWHYYAQHYSFLDEKQMTIRIDGYKTLQDIINHYKAPQLANAQYAIYSYDYKQNWLFNFFGNPNDDKTYRVLAEQENAVVS